MKKNTTTNTNIELNKELKIDTNQAIKNFLQVGCGRCEYVGTPNCKVIIWNAEVVELRNILKSTELVEEYKWSVPCYTINGKNVVILSALKNSSTLNFFKGELIEDKYNRLVSPGPNSQSGKYLKFTNLSDILENKEIILYYINSAIEIEQNGKKVDFKAKNELVYPIELLDIFAENEELKAKFEELTPGKKRAYILHFTAPKQSKTRISRIEKQIPNILDGKPYNPFGK